MYLKNRFIVYQFELLHANKLRLASKHSDWPVGRDRTDTGGPAEKPGNGSGLRAQDAASG